MPNLKHKIPLESDFCVHTIALNVFKYFNESKDVFKTHTVNSVRISAFTVTHNALLCNHLLPGI